MIVGAASAGDPPPAPPPAPTAGAPAAKAPRQRIDLGKGVSFEMVLIPAGEFDMGSPIGQAPKGQDVADGTDGEQLYGSSDDTWRYEDEVLHRVRITKPFWIATTELTQAAWETVTGSNPSSRSRGPTFPVTDVSWDDCQSFLVRLNAQVPGGGFRLPTEAEWEYACRAGTTALFSTGDELGPLATHAWYTCNSKGTAHAVATLEPNAWGLYDMHGNVWEWCADGYAPYGTRGDGVVADPVGPAGTEMRLARGGGFSCPASHLRSAVRQRLAATVHDGWKGFRLARTVAADAPPPQPPGKVPPAPLPAPAPEPPGGSAPPAPPVPETPKTPGESAKPAAPPGKEGEVPP